MNHDLRIPPPQPTTRHQGSLSPQRSATHVSGCAARGGDTLVHVQYPATALACKTLRRLRQVQAPHRFHEQQRPVPQPLGAPARVAEPVATPVAPTPVIVSRNEDSLTPPYNAAVAARFLNRPSNTAPGLGKDRRAFTTNAELAQWLNDLAGMRPANEARPHRDQSRYLPNAAHPCLIAADASEKSHPAVLESAGRPTVVLVGQQHGDEPASAEALLVLARELAPGGLLETLLDKINVIVVPRANPDGSEAGTRVTANGIDMNGGPSALAHQKPEPSRVWYATIAPSWSSTRTNTQWSADSLKIQRYPEVRRTPAAHHHSQLSRIPDQGLRWSGFMAPMVAALKDQGLEQ